MGDIFICHTLYHVLIALVRALRSRPGKSTLVLSTCVPEAETLRAKLLDAAPDLWDAVLIVDEEKLDAQNSESDFYRLRHPFRKPYFTLPKGHVYISNDWSALGRYLQRERRVYTLCEDTFGGTLDPDQHLLDEQRTNPRGPYRYWGDSPCCRTVESEDAARCSIFGVDKLVTVSKAQLLESLTEEEKAIIRRVFLAVPLPEHVQGACLLLPRSFAHPGRHVCGCCQEILHRTAVYQNPPAGYHGLFQAVPYCCYPAPHHAKRGSQFLPALQIPARRHRTKLGPARLYRRGRKGVCGAGRGRKVGAGVMPPLENTCSGDSMELKQRKNLRLQSFDYSSAKYYFVTICTKNRARLFGQIVGNGLDRSAAMELSSLGKTAEKMLLEVPVHFTSTALDAYVIMPNHIHCILAIGCNELSERSRPFPTLPTIIGQYKSGVSRAAGFPVWQKSYHDHIIRNHFDYEEIWLYIQQNPQKWLNDLFYTEF